MTPDEILELSDLNLAEYQRELVRWHSDHRIIEESDLLLTAGAETFPVGLGNGVMALGGAPRDPERMLAAGDAFFAPLGRGFTVWVRDHLDADLEQACRVAGLQPLGDSPGMVLDAPVPPAQPTPGIEFGPLDDADAVRDFTEVSAGAYGTIGLPENVAYKVFEEPERLLRPHLLGVVARESGRPLSTAMALLSHGAAGIYWVGTLAAGRKRGLGDACTRVVSNAAFERGARAVVLQASQQGDPIYRRMGYREVTRYRWWVRFAS